jgi:uncharacterized membrane protein YgcG
MSPSQAGVRAVGRGSGEPPDPPEPVVDEDLAVDDERRPSTLIVVTIVVLVVLVLAAVFGAVFYHSKYQTLSDHQAQERQVTVVSSQFLLALTNFQAGTVDADFNKLESYATGQFESQLATFLSTDIRQALAQKQAVSRGQIRDLYVQSLAGGQAVTFSDIDQTIANLSFSTPEQDELRIVLNLQKVGHTWKISDVTVLQAPAVPTPATGPSGASGASGATGVSGASGDSGLSGASGAAGSTSP